MHHFHNCAFLHVNVDIMFVLKMLIDPIIDMLLESNSHFRLDISKKIGKGRTYSPTQPKGKEITYSLFKGIKRPRLLNHLKYYCMKHGYVDINSA
mgnify:FL=1